MKKTTMIIGAAIAALLSTGAFAQSKGEADEAQSKAVPAAKMSKADKAKAKAKRKAEGAAVAKADQPGGTGPQSTGIANASTGAERKAAAQQRKAAAAEAVKKGQTTSGEK